MIIAWIKKLGNKNKMDNRIPEGYRDTGKTVITSGMASYSDMSNHETMAIKQSMVKRRLFDTWLEGHQEEYLKLKERYKEEVKVKYPQASSILLKNDTYVKNLVMRHVL